MKFTGKTALVTGASKGIGLAIARTLYQEGAKVMICSRSRSDAEKAASSIAEGKGGEIAGQACDVGDLQAVQSFVDTAEDIYGQIDILVNNAAVGIVKNAAELSPEEWNLSITTNLTGVFNMCHVTVPKMRANGGGDIINIASRSSVNPFPGGGAYCATKFGLLGFSECLTLDLRKDRIRVSCIMPGRVNTDFAGEKPEDWHLTSEDVAEATLNVLTHRNGALASRVELRPAWPPY